MPDDSTIPAPSLPLKRLRFLCEAAAPIHLPPYSGSAWRGLIGASLRRSVCVTRQPTCDGCLLRTQCAYSTFFESPPVDAETAARYTALPHPFVLEPEPPGRRTIAPGESLRVGMTLIGSSGALTPYLIHALQRAGNRGLGRDDGRFLLRAVEQETELGSDRWQRIYSDDSAALEPADTRPAPLSSAPDTLRIQLQTPLRLKNKGRFLHVAGLDARAFLGALATRIAVLAALYGNGPRDFEPTLAHTAIDQVTLHPEDLQWCDWTRYSSRQRTHMQLGGLFGTLRLAGPGLHALWPLLVMGQWLHVGKATSFGLGRYRILATDEPGNDTRVAGGNLAVGSP